MGDSLYFMQLLNRFLTIRFSFNYFQSLIRTAEQLKIKGLCEINDHTNAAESDSEVIYPPHKKIRASRNYENNNSLSNSNKNLSTRDDLQSTSAKSAEKDAHPSITNHEEHKRKSKSPLKESKSSNSTQQAKNMASLDMGMVSCRRRHFR